VSVLAAAYGIGYVYVGWAVVIGGGVAYAASVLVRGRRAAEQVPEGRRRWSDPS
jgi:hypothetical protein